MSDELIQSALNEIMKCECEYVSLLEKYETLLEYVGLNIPGVTNRGESFFRKR